MFSEVNGNKPDRNIWKLENKNGCRNFEEQPVPNQLILFSEHPDYEYNDLVWWLKGQLYDVLTCKTFGDICHYLEKTDHEDNDCFAALVDARPDSNGLLNSDQKLSQLTTKYPHLRLIALINKDQLIQNRLKQIISQGLIYDVHSLPVDRARLLSYLGHIQGLVSLERLSPPSPPKRAPNGYGHFIGTSKPMQKVYKTINRISKVDAPVLITGESGTGKEVVARTIHRHSPFRNGPFITINCTTLPASLIESELFGHEPGAFTGALQKKIGKVELADKGTLFLDEIGDMPVDLQTRFLRFLQNSSFERVGGLKSIKIKTRIISATNVDLSDAIKKGQFRQDLYYRLNVLSLHVPPLRDRCEDIRQLADSFLKKFRVTYHKPRLHFTNSSYELMNKYTWPGNVRELISAVRRATILADNRFLLPENLGLGNSLEDVRKTYSSLIKAREDFDRRFIKATLIRNSFNISKAANELQTSRVSLYRLIKKLNIQKHKNIGHDGP